MASDMVDREVRVLEGIRSTLTYIISSAFVDMVRIRCNMLGRTMSANGERVLENVQKSCRYVEDVFNTYGTSWERPSAKCALHTDAKRVVQRARALEMDVLAQRTLLTKYENRVHEQRGHVKDFYNDDTLEALDCCLSVERLPADYHTKQDGLFYARLCMARVLMISMRHHGLCWDTFVSFMHWYIRTKKVRCYVKVLEAQLCKLKEKVMAHEALAGPKGNSTAETPSPCPTAPCDIH